MVFQSYALYPHLTVYDNIAFGLRLRKVPKEEIDRRVRDAARVLGLEDFLDRKPRALSGGQRQRVAMGRAIVREPQAFLMDEPLSNLDAKLRVQMRAEIASLQRRPRRDDALRHARPGRGDDDGRPRRRHAQGRAAAGGAAAGALRPPGQPLRRRLHRQPGDEHARGDARAHERRASRCTSASSGSRSSRRCSTRARRSRRTSGARSSLGIRPEDLEDAALEPRRPPDERASRAASSCGRRWARRSSPTSTVDAPPALTEDIRELAEDVGRGAAVGEAERGRETTIVVGRFGPRTRVQEATTIEVAVDTAALHFFDPTRVSGSTRRGDQATRTSGRSTTMRQPMASC